VYHSSTSIFDYYKGHQTNIILQRNYVLFRILNETGLRLNEILHLKINDFDLKDLSIHVKKTKTNQERYVFYSGQTATLIQHYITKARLTNYLFVDFITGEPLKEYTVESIAQRLRKHLDIPQSISPHKWRHTFATRFVEQNGNMEVLRIIMGHTSLRTTQKYLHINKETLRKEYFRIN
jgi:site-specific recombinase XerD